MNEIKTNFQFIPKAFFDILIKVGCELYENSVN